MQALKPSKIRPGKSKQKDSRKGCIRVKRKNEIAEWEKQPDCHRMVQGPKT